MHRPALLACLLIYIALALASVDGRLSGDEHYALWTGAALRHGDVLNRDVFDPGTPLLSVLSWFGQAASGDRPIGEVVIGITLKAIGLIAVYLLTNRLTRSRALALASAFLVALLILPVDLYGTDKIFIYPVAMLAAVVCLARPSRAWMLGAMTATAFLLRHDHGLYVGVPLALALVLADERRWRHALAAVIALGIIVVPWLVWVEATEGIVSYFASRAAFAQVLGLTASRSSFGLAGITSAGEAALRGLWLLAWAIPLIAGALAVRVRDRAALVVAIGALLASAGLMRRFGQHVDVAAMWVPLGAWIVVQPQFAPGGAA